LALVSFIYNLQLIIQRGKRNGKAETEPADEPEESAYFYVEALAIEEQAKVPEYVFENVNVFSPSP